MFSNGVHIEPWTTTVHINICLMYLLSCEMNFTVYSDTNSVRIESKTICAVTLATNN